MKCDELETEQWLDYGGEPMPCYPAKDVDEAIDELKAENERLKGERRWRKFSEEKPKEKQWILVYYGYENNGCRIELRRWDNGCKYDVEFQELYTHWMPLPKVPEEK